MKNLLLLFALSLLTATNCLAQDKGYFAVSLGPSFPVGDFASKDVNNKDAGLAEVGAIFDLTFAYKLGKNFGISGLLRGQATNVDKGAVAKELFAQTQRTWTVESKGWTMSSFMVGGYGSFPISGKITFEPRAMIGFSGVNSPDLYLTIDGTGGASWVKQDSKLATSFSYLVGAGFKFDVGRRICLLANLDYTGTKPEFKDVETTSSNGGAPERNTFSQNIGTINLGFGVGYRI